MISMKLQWKNQQLLTSHVSCVACWPLRFPSHQDCMRQTLVVLTLAAPRGTFLGIVSTLSEIEVCII